MKFKKVLYFFNKNLLFKDFESHVKVRYKDYYLNQELIELFKSSRPYLSSFVEDSLIDNLTVECFIKYAHFKKDQTFLIAAITGDFNLAVQSMNGIDFSMLNTKKGLNILEFLISQHIHYLQNQNREMLDFNIRLINLLKDKITALAMNRYYLSFFAESLITNNSRHIFSTENYDSTILFRLLDDKNELEHLGFSFLHNLVKDAIKFKNLNFLTFIDKHYKITYFSDIDLKTIETYDTDFIETMMTTYPEAFLKERFYVELLLSHHLNYEQKHYYGDKDKAINFEQFQELILFLNKKEQISKKINYYSLLFKITDSHLRISFKQRLIDFLSSLIQINHPLIDNPSSVVLHTELKKMLSQKDSFSDLSNLIFKRQSKKYVKFIASIFNNGFRPQDQNKILWSRFASLLDINPDYSIFKVQEEMEIDIMNNYSFSCFEKLSLILSLYPESKRKTFFNQIRQLTALPEHLINEHYKKIFCVENVDLELIKTKANKKVKNIFEVFHNLNDLAKLQTSHAIKLNQELIKELHMAKFSDYVIHVPQSVLEIHDIGMRLVNCLRNPNNNYIQQIMTKQCFMVYLESNFKGYCFTFSISNNELKFIEYKGFSNSIPPNELVSEFMKYLDSYFLGINL